MSPNRILLPGGAAALLAVQVAVSAASGGAQLVSAPDDGGRIGTLSTQGSIQPSGLFFRAVGTNGRSCATCHDPASAWSISGAAIRARFEATGGNDPLFRAVDGANAPGMDVSSVAARRSAYSLLLNRGVFRVTLPAPANAEFTVESVDDPNGAATTERLCLYRRPLPSANLRFQTTLQWDGRESAGGGTLAEQLVAQARHASENHMQVGADLGAADLAAMVRFEGGLYTAQTVDAAARNLDTAAPASGLRGLAGQRFVPGMNNPLAGSGGFDPRVFRLYDGWLRPDWNSRGTAGARNLIAHGQQIFNTRKFIVQGVRGFNDVLGQERVEATCSSCHNTPSVGSHSADQLMDLGVEELLRKTADLPRYTLRNRATGEALVTTDPGQGLITGRWSDINRFKIPSLRGLAARAPYFHDGSAATIRDVVEFYYNRFNIDAGPGEKEALEAFLRAL